MIYGPTTVALCEKRIEAAQSVEHDFLGKRQGGLALIEVDEYVIVEDGQDRWLARKEDYSDGIADVIGDILDGKYDVDILKDDFAEVAYLAYSALCNTVDCLYSCIGSPSDPSAIDELDISDENKASIRELLHIEVIPEESRVCGGEGDDYDEGTLDSYRDGMAVVRWDSGVVTMCPVDGLKKLDA